MAYPGGAPVTIVGGQANGAAAGSAANPFVTSGTTGGTAASPSFQREVGAPTIAVGQATNSVSPAAATLIVPARAGRRAVTISNITGTQPVYLVATAATTGLTTGFFIPGTIGAATSIGTSAAIYSTSPTAAQTLSYIETF